ncbi:hypothetical protein FFJ24_019690 [Pedobacter sp. KBS0701]|uniref:glycoside hydrolase family 99-like domain-containing protein n=1 Tax=Pedobacter sp. KBS0701 TaxID=2578106 RepID=UPI00110F10D8|nr:glycoside hydrolase family 99-like domain-containing protein [Pedobacter sp. KBS0701]QDW26918.1 hypothetical protein FFJ24_019690 [Pedobacter sp. KBS0701]
MEQKLNIDLLKEFFKFNMKFVILISFIFCTTSLYGQRIPVTLGAYYFDGWNGKSTNNLLTDSLKVRYLERKPKWGWITSTSYIMDQQIQLAERNGIDFFSFCWYLPREKSADEEPLNNAVGLFMKSQLNSKMKFSILVANHPPYLITPENWNIATAEWIRLFKNKRYLKTNQKPLLTFFTFRTLLQEFGSVKALADSITSFRAKVKAAGFEGVALAVNLTDPNDNVLSANAKAAGFDIFTGYNYHDSGLKANDTLTPINSMIDAEHKVWDLTKDKTNQFIPVTTLNWDPRPWRPGNENKIKRFSGFSGHSVEMSVSAMLSWMSVNKMYLTKERIALVYAWNEYGEGGWLTPSKLYGNQLLDGLRRAKQKKTQTK